jgi:hypothetical protein
MEQKCLILINSSVIKPKFKMKNKIPQWLTFLMLMNEKKTNFWFSVSERVQPNDNLLSNAEKIMYIKTLFFKA